MKVFVTGGTGFIGGAISRALIARGDEVLLLARSETKAKSLHPQCQVVKGDLTGIGDVAKKHLRGVDAVVHCAAHVAPFGNWADFYKLNVAATEQLADAALSCGVSRFLNLSSPSVYVDYTSRTLIKESDPLPNSQVSMYGQSKVLADEILKKAAEKGLNVCSLRPRGVIGAGDQNILPRLIAFAKIGFVPMVAGGQALVDMTSIDNLVDAAMEALNNAEKLRGETFNISNGEPMPIKEFTDIVFDSLDMKVRYINLSWALARSAGWSIETVYKILRKKTEPPLSIYSVGIAAFSQTLDISRAKEHLNYRPRVSLRESISEFATARNY